MSMPNPTGFNVRNLDDTFEDVTTSLVDVIKLQLKSIKTMKSQINNSTKKRTLGELINVTSYFFQMVVQISFNDKYSVKD